ncbi:MAG: hypothetical protein U0163_16875 [Gemmatimonadaceae bacterium]
MPAKRARRRVRNAARSSDLRINALGLTTPFPLHVDQSLQEIAWRWNYVLRNRKRWTSRGEASQRQRDELQSLVAEFGLQPADLAAIADAGLVEVSMPFVREEEGWEYRIFPWEYALAAATRERRHALKKDFTVVRHLRRPDQKRPRQKPALLYVESAPVRALSDGYDFTSERQMIRGVSTAAALDLVELVNPTYQQLRATVETVRPRIIHLTGFDTHQARTLLGTDDDEQRGAQDGYLLSDGRDGAEEVNSLRLAQALTADGTAPDLVSCNLYYSAPRTAALCVALGARAAIGYQDTFDDALAELFYGTIYRAWQFSGHSVTSAFRYAWQQVRAQGKRITGTGLVLWNADSIAPARKGAASSVVPVQGITEEWEKHQRVEPVTAATARADLEVRVKEIPLLNYSILHNNRNLFETFTIKKNRNDIGAVDGIRVNVELHVGRDSYPFRMQTSIAATMPQVDIADAIKVSLASTLSRAVRESIRTSLYIDVRFEDVVLYRETKRVTLLPVDEWQDSDANRKWLPSFVLPRDPAVSRVIDLSQRYLQALRDDPTAGFDGYQSVELLEGRKRRYDCSGVDLQVRAIWSALLYETPLSYINPPPTFTDSSQRLRAPSDVIDGHRGTCIDLALLVASCLEYVEIYPTIILLTDHAFPCYWRAEQYYDDFTLARSEAIDPRVMREPASGIEAPQQTDSWYYVKAHFREVLGEITAGRLVPLETTCLCWKNSYADACDQGAKNLSRRSRFDSMLDIRSARVDEEQPVTPLPLLRVEA